MADVASYLYTWNGEPAASLAHVKIEDDSLRDGLQGAYVRRPSLEEKKELLRLSAAVGTQAAMLGFPASSPVEFAECRELVRWLDAEAIALVPRFLGRATVQDVQPIAELHAESARDVWADFFIGCSPLRRYVEQWTMAELLEKIRTTARFLSSSGTPFGISLEDASRTPPEDLQILIAASVDAGARVLTICDTVGDCTPRGASGLITAVREMLDRLRSDAEIWWHGHDDRGLSLANALAAAEAGAHTISGAFLGIGERTGNTPLEQVVMFLHQQGHPGYRVDRLDAYCRRLAEVTNTPIAASTPLIGEQAFATCTGTHAAAILKARALGVGFEDYVFSSVPASELGKLQNIMVGPGSGLANARHALAQLQLDSSSESAEKLLSHSKTQRGHLTTGEIRALYEDTP